MRITALLHKIHELAGQAENATPIDVDLMLDYTRILYSDLLEWRGSLQARPEPRQAAPVPEEPEAEAPASAPASHPVPAATVAPAPVPPPVQAQQTDPAEPTLEEYMASLHGQAIHREREAVPAAPPPREAPAVTVQAPPAGRRDAPAPQAASPARDIRSMIGINDKYQIMSELFGNDKAAYEQALDVINRSESEQAAFNWLRERLWVTEDHSDAAMIFFDVVRRFKNG